MEKELSKSKNDVKKIKPWGADIFDVWSFLPHEIVRLIFHKLNAESLYNTTFVCNSWSQVARDKKLIKVKLKIF